MWIPRYARLARKSAFRAASISFHYAEHIEDCRLDASGQDLQCCLLVCPGMSFLLEWTTQSHHTQVYKCMVRGIAVMRRRGDLYVNATQILKVAGVDKGRRTKILEKEILPGKHEIVQGGYGKYQETWYAVVL